MKSPFQTILVVIFVAAFVLAIAVFSGLFSSNRKTTSSAPQGNVLVWGVLPQEHMERYVNNFFNSADLGYTMTYVEHTPDRFTQDLVVALANGTPPDVLIFSSELFSQIKERLYTIPFEAYSERFYRDTNIDGSQLFLTPQGVAAIPLLVDPLVVYYNKDLMAAANFVVPPTGWNDVASSIPLFLRKDFRNNIVQTAIALGEWSNVVNSKDILATLFLQSGNPIIINDAITNLGRATLTDRPQGAQESLTGNALSFFTNFSNPVSTVYSWNRALPSSRDMFLSGRSAFYIGRASELFILQSQNPNLNFDVMEMFQPEGAVRPVTFGSFIAVGVLKNAPNFPAGFATAGTIASKQSVDDISKRLSLPPAQRDLLLMQQNNPYVAVFFKAALSSFTWPDPSPFESEAIFRDMIQNVTSGRLDIDSALYEANNDLQSLIR